MKDKPKKIFAILYMVLKPIVQVSIRVFYKDFKVVGRKNMPTDDTPVMLIANHQNGMMDPILLCIIEHKQLHWLTRADIFQKPLVSKILHAVNMLPVYRPKDKIPNATKKNEEIFKEAHRRIAAGNVISVFPEGNHGNKKRLRPVKTGPARIAFGAEESYGFNLGLQIIPIGIEYSNYEKFRSDVLVNYGKPIAVSKYKDLYKQDPIAAVKKFRQDIHQALSDVMIDIQDLELYDTLLIVEMLAKEITLDHLRLNKSQSNDFKAFKYFTLQIEKLKIQKSTAIQHLITAAEGYKSKLEYLKINEQYIDLFGKNLILHKFLLFLLFPLFILGIITVGLPFFLTRAYVRKNVKDPHFKSSIKVSVGGFGYLFYFLLILLVLITQFTVIVGVMGLMSILVLGLFTLKYYDQWTRVKNISKINRLEKTQWQALQEQRKNIKEIIKEFL